MTKSEIFEAKGLAKRCIQTKYQQCNNKIKNSNKTKNITRKPQPKKKAFGKSLSNKKAVKKPKIEQKIVRKSQNTARKIKGRRPRGAKPGEHQRVSRSIRDRTGRRKDCDVSSCRKSLQKDRESSLRF